MSDATKVRASDDHQVADVIRDRVPRITDPGSEGWAAEPKCTQAEALLYGEWAGPVRLLGQAAVDAGDAYSLACKRSHERLGHDPVTDAFYDEQIAVTWQLYETARATHRQVAERAIAKRRDEQPMIPFPANIEEVDSVTRPAAATEFLRREAEQDAASRGHVASSA